MKGTKSDSAASPTTQAAGSNSAGTAGRASSYGDCTVEDIDDQQDFMPGSSASPEGPSVASSCDKARINRQRRLSLPFAAPEVVEALEKGRIGSKPAVSGQVQQGSTCKDWTMLWPLGQGTSGTVYAGSHNKTGDMVAIKVVMKGTDERSRKRMKRTRKEISVMEKLRGQKHIVQLLDSFEDAERIFLVMEYAWGGDLFDYIKTNRMRPSTAHAIFNQIIKTMAVVHSKGIIHRDLKPENIFLDANDNILIGDWGYACRWSSFKKNTGTCGSLNYCASEIVCAQPYTGPEVDIFSMGAVLYTMLTGRLPFGSTKNRDTIARVASGSWFLDPCLAKSDVELLKLLLHPNPFKRPTAYDLLSASKKRP